MKKQLPSSLDHRIITLGDIDEENSNDVIQFIHDINYIDKNKPGKPIKLIINSYGGDIYRGIGIVDAINASITPIHTICYGAALSMGFIIMAVGHHRAASKNSTFMYHEILWSLSDEKLSTHRRELEEGKRIMEIYDNLLYKHTSLTKSKLDSIKKENRDWYMDVEEALKYNIIDEIY